MEKILFYPINCKFDLKTINYFLNSFEEELKLIKQDQSILKEKKEKVNPNEIEDLKIRSCGNSILEISLDSKIKLLKKIKEEYFVSEEYEIDKLKKKIKLHSKELKNIKKYDFEKEMDLSKKLEILEIEKKNLQNIILDELKIKMNLNENLDYLCKKIEDSRCLYCNDKVKSTISYKGFNFPYCKDHFETYEILNHL